MPSSDSSSLFCYVYVLISENNGELYIGYTTNLKVRFAEHNKGLNRSTKKYRPWTLLYYEAHRNPDDAKRRERYLKTTQGSRALHTMLQRELAARRASG
jgi:putative endonuclease